MSTTTGTTAEDVAKAAKALAKMQYQKGVAEAQYNIANAAYQAAIQAEVEAQKTVLETIRHLKPTEIKKL